MANGNLYEIPQLDLNGLTAVDLFCGAGVGAYGIKHSGYNILFGIDNDADAVRTYNLNIGDHAVCRDIRSLQASEIPEHDLMIATPVCKPFSICGVRRLTDDEKYGDLLAETIRLFTECKPKALFFENVGGLVMDESLPIFLEFVDRIESCGYHAYWDLVNCYDLGVPQERVRVFLVAIRDDIPYEFIAPKKLLFGKKSQRDALWDLKDKTIKDIPNHNTDDNYWCSQFAANFKQRPWESPSYTVVSAQNAVLFYPEPRCYSQVDDYKIKFQKYMNTPNDKRPRRFSVREHLRLQTVGDDFYFPEDISIKEQYNRCSGIPSLVAFKYGNAIADCLLGRTELRQKTLKQKKLF